MVTFVNPMTERWFFILILVMYRVVTGEAVAQDVPFEPGRLRVSENTLAHALREIKEGDDLFYQEEPLYKLALSHYLKAHRINPDNALLNFKTGVCYLNATDKFKALDFLEKAYRLNPDADPDLRFFLGQAYHIRGQWDKAIEHYQAWFDRQLTEESRKRGRKRIAECESGKLLQKEPINLKIENAGQAINTPYPEYIPLITADESKLFFTSRREGTTGNQRDLRDDEFFEDIYLSARINGVWQKAVNIGPPVNTRTHDAAAAISPDGLTMIVFKGDRNNGDLLFTYFVNGNWTKPEDPGKNINTRFHESGACISSDGKKLFFISDKPGGYGGRDIYISLWNDTTKNWMPAFNPGPAVNSEYDEEGPFLHPDGKTLFFSSKGHNTMGGYDVFYAELVNGQWNQAVNMGYPLNSPDDDVFFVVNAAGTTGYYSSFKKDGYGEKDIYVVQLPENRKLKPEMVLLRGVVRNAITHEPLEAAVELVNLKTSEHVGTFNSETGTGKYLIALPAGAEYAAIANEKGFTFESAKFEIPEKSGYREEHRDLLLRPVNAGYNLVLNTVRFDAGSATLKDDSKELLNRLAMLMNDYPTMKIEITGHTDNTGSPLENLDISEKRARAVADFLIKAGADKKRITYVGYGAQKPIADNKTPEGRSKNRRIEFRILSR